MRAEPFVPHVSCTVASGDCFVAARCLRKCRTRLPEYEANTKLTDAIRLLSELRDYILTCRGITRYVDGSTIDAAVKEAGQLISRNKP